MHYDFEADTQLLRAMLGTAAHDLGGVASALALRVDVLAPSLPSADAAGLRGVVEHVRTLGRQLRRLRGAAGGSNLAPARERSLTEWLSLLERFGGPILGRGMALRMTCDAGSIAPEAEHSLTYGVLALFSALHELRDEQSATIELRAESEADQLQVTVRVSWGSNPPVIDRDARWWAHARDVITRAALSWDDADDAEVRIAARP